MLLYTVTHESESAIKMNKIFVEKIEYGAEEVANFLSVAKNYYISLRTISESTDFNDRYSDDTTIDFPCNATNMIIKDNQIYGFIAFGNERHTDEIMIIKMGEKEVTYYDGSGYSSTERIATLCKYEFSEEVLNFAVKYKLNRKTIYKKLINGEEFEDDVYNSTFYFSAFNVTVENGKPVALNFDGESFNPLTKEGRNKCVVKESVYGACKYRQYITYTILEVL